MTAHRSEPLLQPTDFLQEQGRNPAPVLFVRISNKDLEDGRPACDLYETDAKMVLERVRKWWLLSQYLAAWNANPSQSPGLLIGLWGSTRNRLVFASVRIDRARWSEAEHHDQNPELISLPVVEPPAGCLPSVDAFELRHRSLAYPNVTFGRTRSKHFRILEPGNGAS